MALRLPTQGVDRHNLESAIETKRSHRQAAPALRPQLFFKGFYIVDMDGRLFVRCIEATGVNSKTWKGQWRAYVLFTAGAAQV